MWIKKYLLQEKNSLSKDKRIHIEITFLDLIDSNEFQMIKEKSSLLSLALVLDTHQPEKDVVFSFVEVKKWGEENSFVVDIDHLNEKVHFFYQCD
ncbi:hypothetical protein T190115A13A_80227 [Tenacibaculum sp. 190524A02b]|uniref:Uncharacterized protein n=1 Tax=Tenacibaculum vairaonense TaxID=3137860 RepID=A0ABM9PS55_9FLAO